MPIITKDEAKVFLKIPVSDTSQDELIAALIPEVEGHYLDIRGCAFAVDADGSAIYPLGSKFTAAQMIGYNLQVKLGVQSESLADYSFTGEETRLGYPKSIANKIRRPARML